LPSALPQPPPSYYYTCKSFPTLTGLLPKTRDPFKIYIPNSSNHSMLIHLVLCSLMKLSISPRDPSYKFTGVYCSLLLKLYRENSLCNG